jgi:hypothetical protein
LQQQLRLLHGRPVDAARRREVLQGVRLPAPSVEKGGRAAASSSVSWAGIAP